MSVRNFEKAALRGEPSYVWRAGQQRRLEMIFHAMDERVHGRILENGCGVGMYVEHLAPFGGTILGLEYDFERAHEASQTSANIINAAGEFLPLPADAFDLILSHEVIEHVQDDRAAICEMVRALKHGGRLALFLPQPRLSFRDSRRLLAGKILFWQQVVRKLFATQPAG